MYRHSGHAELTSIEDFKELESGVASILDVVACSAPDQWRLILGYRD